MTAEAETLLARLRPVLEFVFEVPAAAIGPQTRLHDLPQWSSLSYIVLMTAIENQLGLAPDRDRGWGAQTVADLLALLHDAG